MTTIPFDAIGFDLDGTLLDTQRDLAAAVNHALELGGFPTVPDSQTESQIGGGAKLMLKKVLDAHGVSEQDFRPLYKGVAGLLFGEQRGPYAPLPRCRDDIG